MGRLFPSDEELSSSSSRAAEGSSLAPLDVLNRALLAPLAPSEVIALRRVADSAGEGDVIDERHLANLIVLKLVTQKGRETVITTLGKHRIALES
jgi:hypothetical protein